jgi:hypothetical protein
MEPSSFEAASSAVFPDPANQFSPRKEVVMNGSRFPSPRFFVPALALAAGMATAAPAEGASCIRLYADCLVKAAEYSTWWERTAAGVDCYLDAVACIRGAYF